MRVTLVQPAGHNYMPGQKDRTVLVNRMAPLGILQLASYLEQTGRHEVSIYDCLGPQAPAGKENQIDGVLQTSPELVGFTCTTSGFLDAYEMALLLKRAKPDLKIVCGGVHPSAMGRGLLEAFPAIDYLCIGEGESVLSKLADGCATQDIPGLVYREGSVIKANTRQERIRNLDDLPFPAYEKLQGFPCKYHLPIFSSRKRHGATIVTSRGCPFSCTYCDRSVFTNRYTYNSPAYIWEHMKKLRDDYKVYHVNFYDDLFTGNKKRVSELCELLIRKPLGMEFNCAIRADHEDPEILRLLKRAGCLQVSIGVESADPQLMAGHKPGVTLRHIEETLSAVGQVGLRAKGLFIFGLPGETPQSARRTAEFLSRAHFDEVNVSKFSPFPGAPLWDKCRSEPGRFSENWKLLNCLTFSYLPEGFGSFEQMEETYRTTLRAFYLGSYYRSKFRSRLWENRWSVLHVLKHLPSFWAVNQHFTAKRKNSIKE